jgi:hypothetical protein
VTPAELVAALQAVGVELWVDDAPQLRYRAPAGALFPELRQAVAADRAAVIAYVRAAVAGTTGTEGTQGTKGGDDTGGDLSALSSFSGGDDAPTAAQEEALLHLRRGLTPSLARWDDQRLIALVCWHLALAFDRGGKRGFRRYLPASLAALCDAELANLVDWIGLATLERALWQRDPERAAPVSRGASHLGSWRRSMTQQ